MQEILYFTKKDIETIKNTSDKDLEVMVKAFMEEVREALNIEVLSEDKTAYNGEEDKYENQHENYYDASRPFYDKMMHLGFGYYYTQDERYFEKAKALMLTYAGYKKWHGKGWHGKSELVTSNFCVGMAYGYALFYDKLTEEERKIIAKATYEKGIMATFGDWVLKESKIHALDTMGHNWWIVCVCCAGLAAAVMKDEMPDNAELAETAAKGAKEWFSYKGNPINAKPVNVDNGGIYESVSYGNYSIEEYLRFRYIYIKVFGKAPFDDEEILKSFADYLINTCYPSDKDDYFLNFGDAPGKGIMQCAMRLLGEGFELPELRWYVKSCTHRKPGLFDIVYYNDIYKKAAVKPKARSVIYDKIGWAIFRNSFDKNSAMFAVKCGDTWNHAHADAGSFVFYNKGIPEIYDSGTCGYGAEKYLGYYTASQAHNVILFNGCGQDKRDFMNHARMRGQLYNFVDEEGFKYVAADATGPMGRYFRKVLRHFLWLDKFILIYDDIESYDEGVVSFLLHAEESNSFKMLSKCEISKHRGYYGSKIIPEREVEYSSFNQKSDKECRVKFVSAIMLENNLEIKMTEIDDGFKIECDGIKVYINILSDGRIMHRNCINTMEGIVSDATIVVEKEEKFGVVNSSIVRKGGKSYLDTLARINGWV